MGFLAKLFGLAEHQEQAVPVASGPAKIKGVGQHQTVADKLDWLCAKYKASYSIKRLNAGVVVQLELPDLDIVSSGIQPSTAQAVNVVAKKLEGK